MRGSRSDRLDLGLISVVGEEGVASPCLDGELRVHHGEMGVECIPIQMTFPPSRSAWDARLSLSGQYVSIISVIDGTHAKEVLPTPGGPKTSVTCPRRIPRRWPESSRASSRRARPVLIGSLAVDEAWRDWDADIEITGTEPFQYGLFNGSWLLTHACLGCRDPAGLCRCSWRALI